MDMETKGTLISAAVLMFADYKWMAIAFVIGAIIYDKIRKDCEE